MPVFARTVCHLYRFAFCIPMKTFLNAALLSLALSAPPAWAEAETAPEEEMLSARELLAGCEEAAFPGKPNRYCMQYVFGLVQTVLALQQLEQSPPLFCINPQVTPLEEVTDKVSNFLRANASRLNEDAYILVTEALGRHYPCSPNI